MGDEREAKKVPASPAATAWRPKQAGPMTAGPTMTGPGATAMQGDFSSVPSLGGDLRLNIASFDGFDKGGAKVTAMHRKDAEFVAMQLTSWLSRTPGMRFCIIGHGSVDLGSRRANEIRRLLIAAKVPAHVLTVDTMPGADDGRVEIRVLSGLPDAPPRPVPDIGLTTLPSAGPVRTQPTLPSAPAPTPGSQWRKDPDPLPRGKEPEPTRPGSAGDVLKAGSKVPVAATAIELLTKVAEQRWREAVTKMKAGEWVALGAVAGSLAGGLTVGSIQDPEVGEFVVRMIKTISPSLPVPGADKVKVQFLPNYSRSTVGPSDIGISFQITGSF
ncbi:hypothetical protein NLX83_33480 [Allokutzneria sp. A3M-2-11 16]|uniref:hypothetical protein n=1 Tax=Allokutzneria sp. A3M-2-11 16 TaxID=2962043 RepID=UPI0020B7B57F|nr:hypothetical protein [Allokutzneria sp. A3M-2-11 16]MCP3804196.1 hypothetical protein [Allokutzneria sp. A3M-2-11 16]